MISVLMICVCAAIDRLKGEGTGKRKSMMENLVYPPPPFHHRTVFVPPTHILLLLYLLIFASVRVFKPHVKLL